MNGLLPFVLQILAVNLTLLTLLPISAQRGNHELENCTPIFTRRCASFSRKIMSQTVRNVLWHRNNPYEN